MIQKYVNLGPRNVDNYSVRCLNNCTNILFLQFMEYNIISHYVQVHLYTCTCRDTCMYMYMYMYLQLYVHFPCPADKLLL